MKIVLRLKERTGEGPGGSCVCPECGYTTPHETGKPCDERTCPKCGAKMGRKESETKERSPGRGWWGPPKGTHSPENTPGGETESALAKKIGAFAGVTSRTKKNKGSDRLSVYFVEGSRTGALPRSVGQAWQGLAWSRASSRISGTLEMALRKYDKKDWKMIRLVSEIAIGTKTQAEVPRWLNNNEERIIHNAG